MLEVESTMDYGAESEVQAEGAKWDEKPAGNSAS